MVLTSACLSIGCEHWQVNYKPLLIFWNYAVAAIISTFNVEELISELKSESEPGKGRASVGAEDWAGEGSRFGTGLEPGPEDVVQWW